MKTLYTTYNNFAKRLVMSLMVLMTVGVGSVLGAEELAYTIVFSNGANGNSEIKTTTQASTVIASDSRKYVTTSPFSAISKAYYGDTKTSIRLGTSSAAGALTIALSSDGQVSATKIVVSCGYWKSGENPTLSINSLSSQSISSSEQDLTFNVNKDITSLSLNTSKRAYIYSISVYTEASAPTYAVTWKNGGHGTAPTSPTSASEVTLPKLSATGYTNTGWTADVAVKDGSTTFNAGDLINNGTTVTLSQATTFTAQWKINSYTVTWKPNGGNWSGNASDKVEDYNYGATITTPTNPTRYGYNFTGWTPTPATTMPASDQTYTAQWTEKDLTNYRTTCTEPCEQLGDATGLSVQTDYEEGGQTYVKFSWTPADNTKSHATKQVICIGKVGEEKKCTDLEGNQVWSGDLRSKLTPGEYEWSIQAIGDGETYCDGEVISGPNFTIEEPLTDNCRWVEIPIEDITPEDEIVVTMGDDKTVYALGTETIDPSPKSQAITITSGMIDINQDFDYSKYTWSISAVTGGYQLQPYGTTQYLYGVASYITISTNPTTFSIFTSPENGNKCFMYTIEYTPYYLGHGTEDGQTAWKRVTSSDNLLKSNTLKFYKKTCLPANKFWIDYELANVTCTTDPIPSQIDQTGEDLLLEFSANDGYKLPETISVKMGETKIGNDENYCVWGKETGALLIAAEQITDNITITIEGCERLAAPENLLATNITSTSAVLSWDAVAKADEYIVFVTDGETNLEIPTTNCTITIEGLSKNTYYLWDVTATADNYCDSKKPSVLTNEFTTLDVYTVTFTTNGGTAVEPQPVEHGGKVTKPANPTKTGYTFAGWYTEAECTNVFDFNTPITSPTTIYAKWNANQYTITFLKQWGNGGTDNATVTFNSNNFSVVTIELPTRDGYEFGGYYTETGGAGLQIVDAEGKWLKNKIGYLDASGNWIKAESVNLYAKWTKIHTITWVVNNNTETPHHTSTALDGSTIDALPMPPADDLFEDCDVNAFVGWSTDNIGLEPDPTAPTDLFKTLSEAQSKIGTINGDKKFYAVYAEEIESTTTFKRVHELSELNTSSKIAIINAFNKTKYILPTSLEAKATTPSENLGEITIGDGQYWNIEKDGDNWKFKSGNKYLAGTTIPTNNNKTGALALTESEDNTTWTIVKNTYEENGTPVFTIYNTDNTTAGLEYSNGWILYYATDFNTSWFTLNLYVPRTTYSNYITRCTALPDPVWGEATIDKTEIAVNCGETSSTNGAARISFPKETNYNLYKDITVEVTSGNFIIASSWDGEYTTSVTLTPTQSGTNVGTLDGKYVYVRAVAPPMSSNQLTGTITISGKQITTQVINVTATVTCNEYTLTFNDCGETKTITDFAGTSVEEMEPWAETCSEPFQYVFDGWATAPVTNGTEEYEQVDFSKFTMPNNNTTILYAVYRYAEEGGEPVNGYVKVTEALADWSGDYVIVNETAKKAIKSEYKTNTNSNKTLMAEDVTLNNNMVVSPSEDVIWQIRKKGNYYTMYNETAKKYAYITQGKSEAAGLDDNPQDLMISFNNSNATIYSETYLRCFSYYDTNIEWRTYSTQTYSTGALYRLAEKSIRYTSSLVCGTIEAEDALVTSTKDQKVKVKVPITLESSTGATTINATSDNAAFDVTGLTDVEEGDHTIVVEYTPAEYNITETANITLSATNGATATFTVSGRSLPENFVIATKVGAIWYALPANMNGATNPEGVVIDVDETTMTATAPNTTVYTLFPVATINSEETDRYKEYGERLRFAAVNNGNKGLWANNAADNGTKINNDAAITAANSTAGAAYEWKITTTIVDGNWQYTLQTDQLNNKKYLRYWTAASGGAKWGTYASGNDKLYFLPVTTYTDLDLEVMEWGTNSMVIRAGEDLPQNVNITINGTTTSKTLQNINGSDLYKIDDVTLTSDDCGTIIIDNGSNARKIIRKPLLVSGNKFGSGYTTSPGRDICAECDIVILNGGKLIADEAKSTGSHVDFANIYVYPGGKLVLDGNSLGVKYQVYLRGGYSWINQTTYDLPEVYVNGDINFNGSGNIVYDYYIQNYKYYQFSLPYQVPLAKVTDEAGVDNFPVWVKHYNGALRAANANATSWEWYSGENFEAGIGYIIAAKPRQKGKVANRPLSIIRFPLGNSVISSAEADKSIATTAHGIDAYNAGTITANNVGWNFIGNPFMATWKGDIGHQQLMKSPDAEHWNGSYHWENNDVKYITVMSPDDGTDYDQYIAANTELKPFFPFYLQETADGGAGTINFAAANRIQKAPAELYADEPREAFVQVEILTDRVEDQAGVFISDTYSDDIDFDDYEKIFGSSLEKSKLWFIHEDKRMAFEAMTEASAAANIALGYRAPRLGKYTFAINEDVSALNEVVGVYLTDHELGVTDYNLLYNTYEFETKATNYNDQRFTIRIALSDDSNGVVTGVDNIGTMNDGIYKFIYQDKMYIYNDGIIYDATGKQVTNINK